MYIVYSYCCCTCTCVSTNTYACNLGKPYDILNLVIKCRSYHFQLKCEEATFSHYTLFPISPSTAAVQSPSCTDIPPRPGEFSFSLHVHKSSCCQSNSSKPEMKYLMKLSSPSRGDIRIIEDTASNYKEIGTILLDDRNGAILAEIEKATKGEPKEAIREVYVRWIRQDENYSWQKLTQCFRDCGLNVLAFDIEQHFGLPPPQSSRRGMPLYIILLCCMSQPLF